MNKALGWERKSHQWMLSVMAEAHGTCQGKGKKGCKSQRKQTGERCGTLTFRYDIAVSLLNFKRPWLPAKFSTRLGLPCPLWQKREGRIPPTPPEDLYKAMVNKVGRDISSGVYAPVNTRPPMLLQIIKLTESHTHTHTHHDGKETAQKRVGFSRRKTEEKTEDRRKKPSWWTRPRSAH